MGVPKQKWTSEEESALKAGVAKYGPGKWSTILKDSEFSSILHFRSNVDLKDKWRNMNVMGSGYGSRQRARPAKSNPIHKPENISTVPNEEHDMQICAVDPPPTLDVPLQIDDSKLPLPMPMPRLELNSLILDTIANLNDSHGSSRAEIAEYIEENQSAPPNLGRLLKAELKTLIDCGKLIKVKHKYRIVSSSSRSGVKKSPPPLKANPSGTKIITKADIDAELEKMKKMTPQQAAAVATKAVAEAEAAILEAEKAAKEAEAAEADAELTKVFAAAAMRALKKTTFWT